MAVIVGSARLGGSNGRISGDVAGDQNKKEVSTQNYYVHSKGWRVFRAKDAEKRKKIAQAMRAACKNDKIGYDQSQRNTLYYRAQPYDYDPSKVVTACETDCSALVRVCCAFAGISLKDFNTSTQASVLKASGAFTELTGDEYTKQSARLAEGDILVTRSKGHTVVVLSNGSKVGADEVVQKSDELGVRTLRNGDEGEDVRDLQRYLISLKYPCGDWGADGDFGDATEQAVREFQKAKKLTVDGVYGPKTHAALMQALADAEKISKNPSKVRIVNGNCYVRSAPNTNGSILGVAKRNEVYSYGGKESENGWHLIRYGNSDGWVSGKYSELED